MSKLAFLLNGRTCTANRGETILQAACREGISIPTLCHIDGLLPHNACRVCTVLIRLNGRENLVPACLYKLKDGLEVDTGAFEAVDFRKSQVKKLWARCPSVPALAELARELGVEKPEGPENSTGECCIGCGHCARICRDVAGAGALGYESRNDASRPKGRYIADAGRCIGCGACAQLCPTECISMEEAALQRLMKREGPRRPCRYSLMGLLPGALCANNYQCRCCETDQTITDLCHPHHPLFVAKGIALPGIEKIARRLARDFTHSAEPAKEGRHLPPAWEDAPPALEKDAALEESSRCLATHECTYCEVCELLCPDLCITRHPGTGLIQIDLDYCKGCGLCAQFCPKDAIRMVEP